MTPDRSSAAVVRASRWSILATEVGAREVVFVVGLVLVAVGFWAWHRPLSFIVPGLALIWIALPSRGPFLQRSSAPVDDPAPRPSKAFPVG